MLATSTGSWRCQRGTVGEAASARNCPASTASSGFSRASGNAGRDTSPLSAQRWMLRTSPSGSNWMSECTKRAAGHSRAIVLATSRPACGSSAGTGSSTLPCAAMAAASRASACGARGSGSASSRSSPITEARASRRRSIIRACRSRPQGQRPSRARLRSSIATSSTSSPASGWSMLAIRSSRARSSAATASERDAPSVASRPSSTVAATSARRWRASRIAVRAAAANPPAAAASTAACAARRTAAPRPTVPAGPARRSRRCGRSTGPALAA